MSNILNFLANKADAPGGTYVGANVEDFNAEHCALFKSLSCIAGSRVASEKLHITVVYSKGTVVEPDLLKPAFDSYKLPLKAKIIGAAAFDAVPREDGTRADDVSTLVLKLECSELMQLHAACKDLGCTHTYPELSPHVSLCYDVPKAECHSAVDDLNSKIASLSEPLYVNITKLFTEPIKTDWVKANFKKAA
jgi:hypothetical protein